MPNRIMTELEAGGYVYDLYGKAITNNNGSNSGTPYVYDWIGTQQEYNDQHIERDHPEWVCYITDDVEGGTSVYTKTESDNKFVTKATAETISGSKTFSNAINSTVNTSTYLAGNQGKAIINSTAGAGNYVMLAKMNSTNGYMTIGTYQNKFELHYTNKSTVDAGTNTYTKMVTLLDESGNATFPDQVTATTFNGTANRALWADLAENYKTDETYPIGTLIKFGGTQDITIADDKCNGVISDKPGYVLDSQLENSLPVALAGKTPVRIVGKVNKFDNISLSETHGVGRVAQKGEIVIAKALESSEDENEKLVMCVTKFNLD